MPDFVTLADMPLRLPDWRTWTAQPGSKDPSFIEVLGPGPKLVLPNAERAAAERAVSVPMASRGTGHAIHLRPYQHEAIDAIHQSWQQGAKAPLLVLPTGCHRVGQQILMHDGTTKRVEEIAVGDLLAGPDSRPRTVLNLCRGTGEMVEIVRAGETNGFVVNKDHILTLYRTPQDPNSPYPSHRSAIVDVSVREAMEASKTWKHIHKLLRSEAVEFSENTSPRPIDPYFLGLYITDGSMAIDSHVGVSKPDPEVAQACADEARARGLSVRTSYSAGGCPTHHIHGGHVTPNSLLNDLRALGLMAIPSESRFIPDAYLRGSLAVRRAVLAGLLDGDGSLINRSSMYDFCSKSEKLANDVVFLARGLGFLATVHRCRKGCQGGFIGDYFRVYISGETLADLPMRIPRKRAAHRQQQKNVRVRAFTIRETGTVEPYFGFTLDGDGRYLLNDFTVTHNSGKTIVAAEIMARVHSASLGKCLFLAHRKELLDQTAQKIALVSPNTRVGVVQAKRDDVGREITVASIQTIGHKSRKRLQKVIENGPYRLLVLDEAHHSVAPQWERVIKDLREANPEMFVMGMTATPGREDGIALDRIFDVVAYERNVLDMIRLGWLVPPRGFSVTIDIDLDQVDTRDGDYVTSQLSKVMNTPYVNRAVVSAWQQYGFDRKMLVFAVDIEHAHALAQEFTDAGYLAEAIDGTMDDADRQARLDMFRQGQIKLLVNCQLLLEGYDDPSVEGVVFARPTQSQALYIQAIGRGLRLFPGKTECVVIDCVGNSDKHQPVQLASLAGFDPEGTFGKSKKKLGEEDGGEDEESPEVIDANLSDGREFSFAKRPAGRYQWRETQFGWVLQIPKIGYFLVAWSDRAHQKATIKFFDQRTGRKDSPPKQVVREPVDFELAYGMVEGECDRIFRARSKRQKEEEDEHDEPLSSFVDLDEGLEEATSTTETLMLKNAGWRRNPSTAKQHDLLRALGVKEKSLPETVGEASDLITLLRVERDLKMREPPTSKQLWYLKLNKLPFSETTTKGAAARLIYEHRRATGR